MATGGGFRGVSSAQDARFANKMAKQMKSTKFPKELDAKIDPKKVNWKVMKEWIAKRVTELLGGLEEEVLISLIYNYLEADKLDGKQLHLTLVPFLEKNTSLFMKELWSLLASANQTSSHIPQQLLEAEAAKQAALLQQQQALQAQVERARLEAHAKMLQQQQQLPPPPPQLQPPAGGMGRHEASGRGSGGSRWDADRSDDRPRGRDHDRDRRDFDDRRRDRGTERDERVEQRSSDRDRDGDRRRDGDWERDRGRRSRARSRSRSRSLSRSRSPVRRRTSRSPSPRRRRSRSPETTRERLRRKVRSSQSPEPAAEGKRRESSPRAIKKDKSKTRKKHKKDHKWHSSPSGSEGSGGENSKRGQGSGSEVDEDLQLLMQRAMESAKHRRAESDE